MNNIYSKNKLLSIVLPVFNEEGNIQELYQRLKEVLLSIGYSYEIIFVDDGSQDQSLEFLKKINKFDKSVKVISYSRNFGHQLAITGGMDYSSGDAVIIMDTDLQHPPEIIPQLIKKWEQGYDVVSTIRADEKNISKFKKLTSSLFYKLFNALSDTEITANAPDFRLLDRKVINTLKQMKERARFYRGLINWVGFNQTFITFIADERHIGKTKYSIKKMSKFAFDGITAFSTFPLKIATHLGMMATLLPLPYVIFAIYIRLFTNLAVPGWASILVAVVFLGGVQLITIGIIGEYIARIYDEVKARPLYVIKEATGFENYDKEPSVNNYKKLKPKRTKSLRSAYDPDKVEI